MKQRILLYYLIALLLFPLCKVQATHQPEFSTAGFYQLANSGRDVFSMNPAWRLHKGAAPGAEAIHFDDRNWEVSLFPTASNICRPKPVVALTIREKRGIANTSLLPML